MKRVVTALSLLIIAASTTQAAAQECFWSHIDHRVAYDASGAWNPSVYRRTVDALTIAEIGGALWEGSQSRLGRTLWQGMDAQLIAGLSSSAGQYVFTRVRPKDSDNPCLWFKGGSHHSFPSVETAVATALVTPITLEYARDYPLMYGLLLIPAYVGVGRIKNQAHWQSDVLAGWAIGGVSGWYAHSRETPILIEVLPHGFAIGLHAQF
jgi:undecaprenyl-diphosphatase